jgi:hypothetical protein
VTASAVPESSDSASGCVAVSSASIEFGAAEVETADTDETLVVNAGVRSGVLAGVGRSGRRTGGGMKWRRAGVRLAPVAAHM